MNPVRQWQNSITALLPEITTIPLWGNLPIFPLEQFNAALREELSCIDLQITVESTTWISPGGWRGSLDENPLILALESPLFSGKLFWVLSPDQLRKQSLLFLAEPPMLERNEEFSLPFLLGFYHFLALKVLNLLTELEIWRSLQLRLSEQTSIPDEPMLSVPLSISSKETKSGAHILVSKEILGSIKKLYQDAPPSLTPEQCANLLLPLSVTVGNITLKSSEWQKLEVGDFVILQNHDYELSKRRGKARLLLGERAIALCHLQRGSLKILQHYFDEEDLMDDHEDDEEYEREEDEMDEEDFDEEEMEEDEELAEEPTLEAPLSMETLPPLIKELPIRLSVELTRLKMSLEKVIALSPGNFVELPLSSQQTVTLLANGKAVARGELVLLGEVLGVKIVELSRLG
jgi:flagellar motor switch protein FliN/FliY